MLDRVGLGSSPCRPDPARSPWPIQAVSGVGGRCVVARSRDRRVGAACDSAIPPHPSTPTRVARRPGSPPKSKVRRPRHVGIPAALSAPRKDPFRGSGYARAPTNWWTIGGHIDRGPAIGLARNWALAGLSFRVSEGTRTPDRLDHNRAAGALNIPGAYAGTTVTSAGALRQAADRYATRAGPTQGARRGRRGAAPGHPRPPKEESVQQARRTVAAANPAAARRSALRDHLEPRSPQNWYLVGTLRPNQPVL